MAAADGRRIVGCRTLDGDTPTASENTMSYPNAEAAVRTARPTSFAPSRAASLATVAHDLRQPVSAALVTAEFLDELLATRAPVEVLRRHTALIRRSMQHALRLSNDLLTFGQLDSGTLLLDREPTDVGALLEEVAQLLGAEARGRRVRLHASCGALPRAYLDRHRMLRVLWNLCENAVRHTPAGGGVELSATADEAGIRITVSDSGPGVDQSQLTQLFDWYWQADHIVHRSGAGLGLCIARWLVELHGGAVVAANGSEGGLVVALTLPTQPAPHDRVSIPSEQRADVAPVPRRE
jgi:two-component system sensor histidine kinase BaeS